MMERGTALRAGDVVELEWRWKGSGCCVTAWRQERPDMGSLASLASFVGVPQVCSHARAHRPCGLPATPHKALLCGHPSFARILTGSLTPCYFEML
jgi:hypothetical protein